jgi:uncharacterized protein (DUF362 family)
LWGLDPARQTFLKINGNFDFVYPGANTSGWFLDGLLAALRDHGFQKLTVVEGDLPDFTADQMIQRTGLIRVLQRYNVPFLNYESLPRDDGEVPLIFQDAQLINVPVFHTHGYAVISCATKNLFGLLPKFRRKYHKILSQKLLELTHRVKVFTIVDGTVGLQGESTRRGMPRRLDLILTGWNPIALDAVAATIMGYRVGDIPVLTLAQEGGMLNLDDIQVGGDFTWDTLPKISFDLGISGHRRVIRALDGSKIGDLPLLVWVISRLRRAFHYCNYFLHRKSLFDGPWMEYERVPSGE